MPSAGQVHRAVVGGHAHFDVRVGSQEGAEPLDQPQSGQAGGRGERHQPAPGRAFHRVNHVLQLGQRAIGSAEQALALRRERDRTIAAHQQFDPERVFQRLHLPAHRRLGQAQVARGERDAHAPANGDEAAHQVEGREAYEW